MSKKEIRQRIKQLRRTKDGIQEALPYADGSSYHRDKDRIIDIDNQIKQLEKQLEE